MVQAMCRGGEADLGCAGLEKPVEAEAPVVPDGGLQLIPGPIAQLVHLA